MSTPLPRIALGFIAAAVSVVTFHQGMIIILSYFGAVRATPYNMTLVGPLHIPQIVNLMFWGGLYGAVFGWLRPRFTWPLWLCGIILGIIASLVGMFIVAAIKGNPIANGWAAWPMARSLLINGVWGLGVGLIGMVLLPRANDHAYR